MGRQGRVDRQRRPDERTACAEPPWRRREQFTLHPGAAPAENVADPMRRRSPGRRGVDVLVPVRPAAAQSRRPRGRRTRGRLLVSLVHMMVVVVVVVRCRLGTKYQVVVLRLLLLLISRRRLGVRGGHLGDYAAAGNGRRLLLVQQDLGHKRGGGGLVPTMVTACKGLRCIGSGYFADDYLLLPVMTNEMFVNSALSGARI